jgi:hypothetical protein
MIAAAAGSPAPIQLGDRAYDASPLNLYQLGALEEIVRASIQAEAVAAAAGMSPADEARLKEWTRERVRDVGFGSPDTSAFLRTFRGTCALIALSLRARHPEMDAAAVGAVLSKHIEHTGPAIDTVLRISGLLPEAPADEKGAPQPGEGEKGDAA